MGHGCSIGGHCNRRAICSRAAQPLGAWAGKPIATARHEAPPIEVILAWLDPLRCRDLYALKSALDPRSSARAA
jgi:hypothetical protein